MERLVANSKRYQLAEQAVAKSRREGITREQAMEALIMDLPPSEKVMDMIKDAPALDTDGPVPFEFVSQLKLFKAGLLGPSVSIWSSYEGGFGPSQLMLKENEPVVIFLADPDVETQVRFGAAYLAGYVEGIGGDIEKMKIWLVPEKENSNG